MAETSSRQSRVLATLRDLPLNCIKGGGKEEEGARQALLPPQQLQLSRTPLSTLTINMSSRGTRAGESACATPCARRC